MSIRHQSYPLLLLGVVTPLNIFVALAITVSQHQGDLLAWDQAVLEGIHATKQVELEAIAISLTQLGRGTGILAITVLISLFLAWRKQWRSLIYLVITVLGSGILNQVSKLLFHRDRPALWASPTPEFDFSFPSGHAMLSMTLVIFLVTLIKQGHWRSLFLFGGLIFVVAIGWTRLYLGVHYPSDILGGWALAIAWVMGVSWLSRVNGKL
ncbi:phosphatase PAP2 family protein [Pseudanabaena sp. ABRG5-3]|uniref:phosphatase PAP2 family protein n=1 Tax=Pseudanabaena sp. ABRG5-3 TaxID=685565 RepID=UPI000DC6FC66|nr:phosphatase PAP2 family protein [Pseudanabaena sp. ABRG5-3]BBC26883.1 phosphoesterase, PA-phosphatase related protein [Pseudanabaena sp. ABRG5-3]